MVGLVEEIQALALDPSVKIGDLLRRVKLAAVKLQLDDATEWVDRELKGYTREEDTPSYRRTVGQLQAHTPYHGVLPVVGDNEAIRQICKTPIGDSIARVESLAGDGTGEVIGGVTGAMTEAMNKANQTPGTQYFVHTPQSVFLDILEQVRNLVLEWAIQLEKAGIQGEGMSFTVEEKKKAVCAVPSIYIQNFAGSFHQGNITGDQNRTVVNSTDNSDNVVDSHDVFQEVIQAVDSSVTDERDRESILEIVRAMEKMKGTSDYKPMFQKLVSYAADYATVLGPFLPTLSHFVS